MQSLGAVARAGWTACGRRPSTGAPRPESQFDLVLENGHVIDGTGAAWFLGDVAINGARDG